MLASRSSICVRTSCSILDGGIATLKVKFNESFADTSDCRQGWSITPVRRFEVLVARFFFAGIRKLHHAGAAAAGRAS